ncbi:MAG: VacJ family lipoprotein, partial [Pseudomonadota bacterium]
MRLNSSTAGLARVALLGAALTLAAAAPAFAQEEPAAPAAETAATSEDDLLDSLEEDYASEESTAAKIADPHEPANRFVFGFNQFLDTTVLKPVAYTYRWVTPEPIRVAIGNVVNNTYAPITIVNAALQGDRDKVGDTTVRFLLNTTLGMGGLLDVATLAGLPQHYEDFGQTMAAYGVPSGDYIVVPVLGPGTPRHLAGRAVDYLTNPLTWLLWDTSLL